MPRESRKVEQKIEAEDSIIKNVIQVVLNLDFDKALKEIEKRWRWLVGFVGKWWIHLVSAWSWASASIVTIFRLYEAFTTPPYSFQVEGVSLSPDEFEFLNQKNFWLTPEFGCSLLILLLMPILLCIWGKVRQTVGCCYGGILLIGTFGLVVINLALPIVEEWGVEHSKAEHYCEALEAYYNQNYEMAEEEFSWIYRADPSSPVSDESLGYVGGSLYWSGQTKEAIETYARILVEYPQSTQRDTVTQSLHWAVYRMGKETSSLRQAVDYLMEMRDLYPTEELSIYWLAISPEIYHVVMAVPFHDVSIGCMDSPDPDCGDRMSSDLDVLARLVKEYPQERYRDLALFILGQDELAIRTIEQGPFLDHSYYRPAHQAYRNEEYREAIEKYQRFLDHFPNHRWADDAAYRIATSHHNLGQYAAALRYYALAQQLPDGDMQHWASAGVLKIIDFRLNAEEIQELLPEFLGTSLVETLEYSFAEALMEEDRFTEAREQFEHVRDQYPNSEIVELCNYNIALADRLIQISASSNGSLELARFLLEPEMSTQFYDQFEDIIPWGYDEQEILIYYNELWRGSRRWYMPLFEDADLSAYISHNDNTRAILLLEQVLSSAPSEYERVHALYLLGEAYRNLSLLVSFLPYEGVAHWSGREVLFLKDYDETLRSPSRSLAHDSFKTIVDEFPDTDWAIRAQAEIAQLYLFPPWDFEQARAEFRTLIRRWPDHRLANNSLMWIARTYLWDARSSRADSPISIANYEEAVHTYQGVLERYPQGHVGEEASKELEIARQELEDARD